MTASDHHYPASSRAMATLAVVDLLRRSRNVTQRACRRRLPTSPQACAAAGGQVPSGAHGGTGDVPGAVVLGGLDQQPAHVGVAGLGDRPLCPRAA